MYQLLLIAAAVIPAVWLLIRVYRADRLEKEPTRLLLWLVILGVIATALASVTEQLGDMALTSVFPEENIFYNFLLYFVVDFSALNYSTAIGYAFLVTKSITPLNSFSAPIGHSIGA